jgi:ferredoxin
LPHACRRVFYTAGDEPRRLDRQSIAELGLPSDATAYLCGPAAFMDDMRDALTAAGLDATNIHTELFGSLPPINPGVVGAPPTTRPHPPDGVPGPGPRITFARSGLSVNWSPDFHTLLEFAEACDVPTRYSCRSGVCHTCATPVIEGTTDYSQPPLEAPAAGDVLLCTATPHSDLVLDL